jgi:hypothetical protein
VDFVFADAAVLEFADHGGGAQGNLVEAVLAADQERPARARTGSDCCLSGRATAARSGNPALCPE